MSTDSQPIVAVVGRPNVGKSTLFNRLVGRRLAIVHDQPGVTRDRSYADAVSFGRRYTVIDTGGFDPDSDDELQLGIDRQIEIAVAEADAIVCVLDATTPPTAADAAQTARLRQAGKPVLFVANKCDSQRLEHEGHDLYRLGMEQLLFVSALHGRGFGELDRALAEALPPLPAEPAEPADEAGAELRIAVVGRPNAGKSSLINRLLGQERLLVDARPGTTRDPIDSLVERRGRRFIFVDTAGLRRKAQVARGRDTVEALSVISAIRAIDRSRLVVLLVDAELGLAEQDTKIVGLALDRGRAIVIGLNKMDKLDAEGRSAALRQARETLSFAPWAPVTTLCAKSGRGVDRLLDVILEVSQEFGKRIGTGQLNRFFETVLATHPPPIHKGRAPRFYYITQPQTCPPTFVVMTSHPDSLHFSYQRYVQNSIRQSFGFEGTPIRVHYRRPDRRPAKKSRRRRR